MSIIVPSNHTRIGAWVNSKMSGRNPLVYICIVVPVSLVKIVWDKSGGRTCRRPVLPPPLR